MDAQQIFDAVTTHLLTQNAKAGRVQRTTMLPRFQCLYRDEKGRKCAAGIFISDAEYKVVMEGQTIGMLTEEYHGLRYLQPHRPLLSALQIIHDEDEPHNWAERLTALASRHGLSASVVEEHGE